MKKFKDAMAYGVEPKTAVVCAIGMLCLVLGVAFSVKAVMAGSPQTTCFNGTTEELKKIQTAITVVASRQGPSYAWVSQERANYAQVQDFLTALGPMAHDAKVVTEPHGDTMNRFNPKPFIYRIYYRVEKAEERP